jgi:PPOX class probable F420-dependent enzyme
MNIQSITRAEQPTFAQPGVAQVALLTTFRRNGQAVSTPVGTMIGDGNVYFMTPAKTGKAKRIRNNPQVTLAPCTFKGERLGPTVTGVARRLSGNEAGRARRLICVGILGFVWDIVYRLWYPGDKTAVYEISLVAKE